MKPRDDRPRPRVAARPAPARKRRAPRIRIVVAESRALDRQAFAVLLGAEKDFEVVGQAADAAETIALCTRLRPAVLVLALDLPGDVGRGRPCRPSARRCRACASWPSPSAAWPTAWC